VRHLLDRLDKENSGVGQFIVDALAEIGDVQVVPVLCRTTRSHNLSLRYSSVRALGKLGDRRAIPFLVEALGDTASIVRLRAVESLSAMGEPTLWVPISEMLADQSAGVRAVAARVLGEMHCMRAINYLLPLLESDIETDVLEAARALGRIGSRKAVEPLINAREREGRERVIRAIDEALQAIGEASQD
jgi:HEAT repeat protein